MVACEASQDRQIPWSCDFVASPRGRLFRACALAPGRPTQGILLVNPLGEEAKSAFSVFNDFCLALWRAGHSVGRFDARGTGDSEGDFSQTGPEDWIHDARCALADFQAVAHEKEVVLLGLRIGANIAAQLAAEPFHDTKISALILWEPVLDFPKYLRHLGWVNRNPDPAGPIDHYGWRIARSSLDAMESRLTIDGAKLCCPVFAAQIKANGKLSREFEAFGARLPVKSRLERVESRPFWEPIGQTNCDSLIARTADWLRVLRLEHVR